MANSVELKQPKEKLFSKKNAILIDDYQKNVDEFTRSGGIGIHHTDTSKTISQLKRLGF